MTVAQIIFALVVFSVGILPFWAVHSLSKRRQLAQAEQKKKDSTFDGSGGDAGSPCEAGGDSGGCDGGGN